MRHGRAEPYAASDFARALTARGRLEASAVGRYLVAAGMVPDHAVVSSATRATATWDEVRAASGSTAGAEVDRTLYGAEAEAILEALRLVPEAARTVLFVGHNPGVMHLASVLDGGDGDPDAVRGLLEGFPTAALAAFEVTGSWADLTAGSARLTHYHVGR